MLPYWTVGAASDAALVNDMLDNAIPQLREMEHPIVHSDRGYHYYWPGWISRMEKVGSERSMSKKGCFPDNSAHKELSGRLKSEILYSWEWTGVSIQEFIDALNKYLVWCGG